MRDSESHQSKLHADQGQYENITVSYQLYFHGRNPTPEQLRSIVQAAIMAAPQPLSLRQLQELFGDQEPVSRQQLQQALQELQKNCADGGVDLV